MLLSHLRFNNYESVDSTSSTINGTLHGHEPLGIMLALECTAYPDKSTIMKKASRIATLCNTHTITNLNPYFIIVETAKRSMLNYAIHTP